jgi:hypothetical protein
MEEWFIIKSYYHGLIRSAREHNDDVHGGSFFTLSIKEARALIENMSHPVLRPKSNDHRMYGQE